MFTGFITGSALVRRTPYTAVKRISKVTSRAKDEIMSFALMDTTYAHKNGNDEYPASIGHSLNIAANELADVLHTFFLNVVEEE